MQVRVLIPGLVLALCPAPAVPQSPPAPREPSSILVKAGRLLDVRNGKYIEGAAVWIEGARIKEAGPVADVQGHAPSNIQVIDLKGATVLPGLIDCHTHLMARFADSDDG